MDLSIVIVNWNTCELLAQCLASIFEYPPAGDFEVIVVDNASGDSSTKMVREHFPLAQLIENDRNPGFAVANNQAILQGKGRYVLLLNPDTTIHPDALSELLAFMEHQPDAGAAGSMLLNPDGSLQLSCHPAPTLAREFWRLLHLDAVHPVALYPMSAWSMEETHRVDTAQGASLIVRRAVIEDVGLLDESYFMYSEEVDWCTRIRQAGWHIYWVPRSKVVHYGGQSTRQVATAMFVQLYRAKLQYFRKHYGLWHGTMYKWELFVASSVRLALAPLAWFSQPSHRQEHAVLVQNYSSLIRSLPEM